MYGEIVLIKSEGRNGGLGPGRALFVFASRALDSSLKDPEVVWDASSAVSQTLAIYTNKQTCQHDYQGPIQPPSLDGSAEKETPAEPH